VFDGNKTEPYEIDDPTGPLNVYGATKLGGEAALRQITEKHYIVRTSWVYGQSGTNFPKSILKAAAQNRPLRVVIDQTGSPTYAKDLAEAISILLGLRVKTCSIDFKSDYEGPAPYGSYHVTNSGFCTWYEFAVEILRQSGWDSKIEAIESSELARPAARPKYSVLSGAGIENLGWKVRDWKESLNDFLAALCMTDATLFPESAIVTRQAYQHISQS